MKYISLGRPERLDSLAPLSEMIDYLRDRLGRLSPDEAARSLPKHPFSPVEHVWHLTDVELGAFAVRIRRLLDEDYPVMPDFDGAKAAREGRYRDRSMAAGLTAFSAARLSNVDLLASITGTGWSRMGYQEGIGKVSICEIPALMAAHDAEHRCEIDAWVRSWSSTIEAATTNG